MWTSGVVSVPDFAAAGLIGPVCGSRCSLGIREGNECSAPSGSAIGTDSAISQFHSACCALVGRHPIIRGHPIVGDVHHSNDAPRSMIAVVTISKHATSVNAAHIRGASFFIGRDQSRLRFVVSLPPFGFRPLLCQFHSATSLIRTQCKHSRYNARRPGSCARARHAVSIMLRSLTVRARRAGDVPNPATPTSSRGPREWFGSPRGRGVFGRVPR